MIIPKKGSLSTTLEGILFLSFFDIFQDFLLEPVFVAFIIDVVIKRIISCVIVDEPDFVSLNRIAVWHRIDACIVRKKVIEVFSKGRRVSFGDEPLIKLFQLPVNTQDIDVPFQLVFICLSNLWATTCIFLDFTALLCWHIPVTHNIVFLSLLVAIFVIGFENTL